MLPASATTAATTLLSVGGFLDRLSSGDGHLYLRNPVSRPQLWGTREIQEQGAPMFYDRALEHGDHNGTSAAEEPDNPCQDPVGVYGQCGGIEYDGSTCCLDGYECEASDEFYSQCRPQGNETTTSFDDGIFSTEEPDNPCQDPAGEYGQCGGKEYDGSTCCLDGYQCESTDEFYSQCRPKEDETTSSDDLDNLCQDPVEEYGQCGGKEYDGSTCCLDGYQCEESNESYSQCLPEEDEFSTSSTSEEVEPSPSSPTTVGDGDDDDTLSPTSQPQQAEQPQQRTVQPQPTQQPQQPTQQPHQTQQPQQPGKAFYRPGLDETAGAAAAAQIDEPEAAGRTEDAEQIRVMTNQTFYRPGLDETAGAAAVAQINDLEAAGRTEDAEKIRVMINQPMAVWVVLEASAANVQVQAIMEAAGEVDQIPILALYYLPFRDCTQYSEGGATSMEEYDNWIADLASTIGAGKVDIVLEPDGLAIIPYATTVDGELDWCQPGEADPAMAEMERYAMTRNAITVLKANSGTKVYIDGSHADWIPPREMATRLVRANVQDADGFFTNVSNFVKTERQIGHCERVAKCVFWGLEGNDMSDCTDDDAFYEENVDPLIAEKGDDDVPHCIIDTSRNANDVWTAEVDYPDPMEWCNPPGRALGQPATTETGSPYVDFFTYVKTPGGSDGPCNRGLTDQGGVDPEWGVVDPDVGDWFPAQVEVLIGATGT